MLQQMIKQIDVGNVVDQCRGRHLRAAMVIGGDAFKIEESR